RMLIMIAGPYTSEGASALQRAENLRRMNLAALAVWDKGHTPLIGVNAVMPMIECAGHHRYDELMMPICLDLAGRCDAVLRIGGFSRGADQEVERIASHGGRVFRDIAEVPAVDR
ncbi:MAG: hypothetical protein SFV21_16140, partial [Rhodospirillaceae bacterium]|nr:hypothetical protein [Rhodospirillaceae bacterium]